ncbi:MAG TPA: hypothetical protein VM639_05365 [Dongiaceae bacterium]|nr:hypothetical protein [Dongiaceae bacterium]
MFRRGSLRYDFMILLVQSMGAPLRGFTPSIAFAIVLSALCPSLARATDVTLTASMGHGAQPITTPVTWNVVKLDEAGKPLKAGQAAQTAAVFKADLPTGHYQVVAQNQGTAVKQTIFVGQSALMENIVLGIAHVSVQLITSRGRAPIKEPIDWQLFTYQKGKTESGTLVDKENAAMAHFSVPGGGYVVRAKYKDMTADLVMPLNSGQTYDYTINLYAGYAKFAALANKAAVKQKVTYQIVRQKPNDSGQYELIAEKVGATPDAMLREGNYLVIARYGKMWGVEKLAVQNGQTSTVKVTVREGLGAPVIAVASN